MRKGIAFSSALLGLILGVVALTNLAPIHNPGATGGTGPAGPSGSPGPQGSPGPEPTPAYLVYTALLMQSGTDAPVATVVGTTTIPGGLTWSYVEQGRYRLTSDVDAFLESKTIVQVTGGRANDPTNGTILLASRLSDSAVDLFSIGVVGSGVPGVYVEMNNLGPTSFEVHLYP